MTELNEALNRLEKGLQTTTTVTNRLQPGLSRVEIDQRAASFSWTLPGDVYALYQWHNGLSGTAAKIELSGEISAAQGEVAW
jgi:cell wall assembly regulator SMI1